MRNLFITLIALLLFGEVFAQQRYELGVILIQVFQPEKVTFDNGQVINGSAQLHAAFQKYPATGSRKLSHVNAETDGCYRIEYPLTFPLMTIADLLKNCPDIKHATLNNYGILAAIPNDPLWPDQWALQKIQMPIAWDVTKPSSDILVGIMDTGLDYTHVDLIDNIWTNPNEIAGNGIDDDSNGKIDDINGWDFVPPNGGDNDPQEVGTNHGTRVAGVIAARTYNSLGIAGIAGGWQNQVGVRLIGLRISDQDGWNQQRAKEAGDYLTWLRQHYDYTIIANMSFQTDGLGNEDMPLFAASVNAAKNAGIILVAAAGNTINDPRSPYYNPEVAMLPVPARYSGVLAIGASKDGSTLQEELRSPYSLYDMEAAKLLVVAPVDDHVGSGINIYTTYPNNNYVNWFNGTSAACPIAVGVVSLIKSINPSLDFLQIQEIFKSASEKIGNYTYGPGGRADEVGHGRINAYQSLLLALAYANKTPNISPTIYNNQRILTRGKYNTNYLYEAFHSGTDYNWEILFRKSTDNGSTWLAPQRLSAGDLNNQLACIAVTYQSGSNNDEIHIVWQHKKANGKYQIYYRKSPNSGISWDSAVLLADEVSCSSSQSAGPMPVITSVSYSDSYKLMVVWVSSTGLKSRTAYNGQWATTLSLDDSPDNDKVWFPSLMGKGTFASLTYDTRYNGVYSRIYNGTSWSSRAKVNEGSGTWYDRSSQVAIRVSSNPMAAWFARTASDSRYRILFRSGNSDNTWSSWFEEFAPETGKDCYYPSLTDYSQSGQYRISIVYYTSAYEIKLKKWVNSTWNNYTLTSNGRFSNITHESASILPKMIWTDQSGSPYQMVLSSQSLSKPQFDTTPVNHRRAIVENRADHSSLAIEIGELLVHTSKGEVFSVAFPTVDPCQNISFSNLEAAMYYLIPDTVTLPPDAS